MQHCQISAATLSYPEMGYARDMVQNLSNGSPAVPGIAPRKLGNPSRLIKSLFGRSDLSPANPCLRNASRSAP